MLEFIDSLDSTLSEGAGQQASSALTKQAEKSIRANIQMAGEHAAIVRREANDLEAELRKRRVQDESVKEEVSRFIRQHPLTKGFGAS